MFYLFVIHLFVLLTAALPSPSPMTQEEFDEQGVWGPTAVFYWRCRTPLVVETSWDLDHWTPSSVCLEGTCCSPLTEGPLCSREACTLAGEQQDRPIGQDPRALLGGRVPKRPNMGEKREEEAGK